MLQRYRARWLFPIDRPPIAGGVLTVRDGFIVEIAADSDEPVTDLGDVAILPALINAHTHLEFSDLAEPLGTAREPLPTWIRRVVAHRRSQPADEPQQLRSREQAHAAGLSESAAAGVAAVGEIATPGWPEPPYREAAIGGVVFLELLGLAEERLEPLLQLAREHLQRHPSQAADCPPQPAWPRWLPGLSPHAPYTVHPRLLAEACQLAAARQVPVAMHLAESREELELLANGRGAMRELLESLGAWRDQVIPAGTRIIDYLRPLATARARSSFTAII
ncbi:MAG: amidohydrolase family protein [Pirellulaceae bacterium]